MDCSLQGSSIHGIFQIIDKAPGFVGQQIRQSPAGVSGASGGTEPMTGLKYSVCIHQSHCGPTMPFLLLGILSQASSQCRVGSKRKQAETTSPVDFLFLILVAQGLKGQNQGGWKEKTSPPDGTVTGAQCGVACRVGAIFVHSSSHGKCTHFISASLRVASNYGAMTSTMWYMQLQLRWLLTPEGENQRASWYWWEPGKAANGSCGFYLFGPLYGSLKAAFLEE